MFIRFMSRFAPLVILTALSPPTIANAQDRPTISAFIEDLGPRFTSNAFLSEKNARSDVFVSPATGIGVAGLFAPGLAYSFSAVMVNTRYRRFSELDDDTVVLAGERRLHLGCVDAGGGILAKMGLYEGVRRPFRRAA